MFTILSVFAILIVVLIGLYILSNAADMTIPGINPFMRNIIGGLILLAIVIIIFNQLGLLSMWNLK